MYQMCQLRQMPWCQIVITLSKKESSISMVTQCRSWI